MKSLSNTWQATPSDFSQGIVGRHPLISFFILAYAISWLFWLPVSLSKDGIGIFPFSTPVLVLVAIGTFGPTFAAFITAAITQGRAGVRLLLRRYLLWRVGLVWYLLAILGIPLFQILTAFLTSGATSAFYSPALLQIPSLFLDYLLSSCVSLPLGGPLGEEGGWRGFALPRMQPLLNPLGASLVLGVFWALWHLPLFYIKSWGGGGNQGQAPTLSVLLLYVIIVLAFSVIFTWFFNNTKGSLLLAILLHNGVDSGSVVFPTLFPQFDTGPGQTIGYIALAILLITLTRAALSYKRYLATNLREPEHREASDPLPSVE
jgi:membrane protease YdiL (CAAX protease family)